MDSASIVLQSRRPAAWEAFVAVLEAGGYVVERAEGPEQCRERLRTRPPRLVLLDPEPGADARRQVMDLMTIDARTHTAVVSDLPEEAFHDAMEGLGILTPLPVEPDAAAAAALLELLART